MPKLKSLLFLLLLLSLLLTACAGSPEADAARTAESFWQALAAKDTARLSSLSCSAYEGEALTTLESFRAVEVKLEDVACTASQVDENTSSVTCKGTLVASYGAEDLEIDLAQRAYRVVKEAGDWRMCGEE